MSAEFKPVGATIECISWKEQIRTSGLEPTKAQIILEQFTGYFAMAAEWEAKAKAIVITDVNQRADMEIARIGRLFLKEKRLTIEKTRKSLKEQSLREGKAIDGIAQVLKSLIEPIESYLEKQERFAEYREAERVQAAKALLAAQEAQEQAQNLEAERMVAERLKAENDLLKAQMRDVEAQASARQAEMDAEMARIRAESAAKSAAEFRARMESLKTKKASVIEIACPHCHKTFMQEVK